MTSLHDKPADRASVTERASALRDAHTRLFPRSADVVVAYAPGRAEILGNHTDYNEGFTLSANVQQNMLAAVSRRADRRIRLASLNRDSTVVEVDATDAAVLLAAKPTGPAEWAAYPAGVLWALLEAGHDAGGFDAVYEGDIPPGGLSASAALELATAHALAELYRLDLSRPELVRLCHTAETAYVGVPCGFLDQATVGLAESGLLMSYRPEGGSPFTYEPVDLGLEGSGWQFVVGYDQESSHVLTDGRYAARRRVCEESVPVLAEVLGRPDIRALRDVSVDDLAAAAPALGAKLGPVAVGYVTHIVTDNARVLTGREALSQGDFAGFGATMTESGDSAINRYDLADGSPELRFCYETGRAYAASGAGQDTGVAGIRNMGGGFNATTLSLVRQDALPAYAEHLRQSYLEEFGRPYLLVPFTPAPAAALVD